MLCVVHTRSMHNARVDDLPWIASYRVARTEFCAFYALTAVQVSLSLPPRTITIFQR